MRHMSSCTLGLVAEAKSSSWVPSLHISRAFTTCAAARWSLRRPLRAACAGTQPTSCASVPSCRQRRLAAYNRPHNTSRCRGGPRTCCMSAVVLPLSCP
jgi:hypothetical protein